MLIPNVCPLKAFTTLNGPTYLPASGVATVVTNSVFVVAPPPFIAHVKFRF